MSKGMPENHDWENLKKAAIEVVCWWYEFGDDTEDLNDLITTLNDALSTIHASEKQKKENV